MPFPVKGVRPFFYVTTYSSLTSSACSVISRSLLGILAVFLCINNSLFILFFKTFVYVVEAENG
jgi:hypothetical protein